ncbi:hypothetical protein MARCHEWKA_02170 [Brevundimonas phage vB_BpoS-Marchewka]|uniref:Uncharacterized protein n=1 Tax=Brevundimonas phage vB_BpoS-Marchewka TaxID=2948604 RepID=A0A9E7SR42_9CAUD|nr:hypothetical protein MARCHEWKA_02170 [Brevundimonas phage vB_BpoS-Marchewka]
MSGRPDAVNVLVRYLLANPEIAAPVCRAFGVNPGMGAAAVNTAIHDTVMNQAGRSNLSIILDILLFRPHPLKVLSKHLMQMREDPRAQALRAAFKLTPSMDAEITGYAASIAMINAWRDRAGERRLFELPPELKGSS